MRSPPEQQARRGFKDRQRRQGGRRTKGWRAGGNQWRCSFAQRRAQRCTGRCQNPRGDLSGIKLGSAGNEPKLRLGAPSGGSVSSKGTLELAVRTGPARLYPPCLWSLRHRASWDAATALFATKLKVVSARLGDEQPGQIPPELAAMITSSRAAVFPCRRRLEAGAARLISKRPPRWPRVTSRWCFLPLLSCCRRFGCLIRVSQWGRARTG